MFGSSWIILSVHCSSFPCDNAVVRENSNMDNLEAKSAKQVAVITQPDLQVLQTNEHS
jgi:hypothetical protein